MRRFQLRRREDVNGLSGTGVVVQGVEFDDGTCVIRWISDTASTTVHDSVANVEKIHSHEGRTVLEWLDHDDPVMVIPAKLGWSNSDTGPVGMRLYALDNGDSPRWAEPHARVVEQPMIEAGMTEGSQVTVIVTDAR